MCDFVFTSRKREDICVLDGRIISKCLSKPLKESNEREEKVEEKET